MSEIDRLSLSSASDDLLIYAVVLLLCKKGKGKVIPLQARCGPEGG